MEKNYTHTFMEYKPSASLMRFLVSSKIDFLFESMSGRIQLVILDEDMHLLSAFDKQLVSQFPTERITIIC